MKLPLPSYRTSYLYKIKNLTKQWFSKCGRSIILPGSSSASHPDSPGIPGLSACTGDGDGEATSTVPAPTPGVGFGLEDCLRSSLGNSRDRPG